MTIGSGDWKYNPSSVLYGRAITESLRAVLYAREHRATGSSERRNRETEAAITTIVLAHAAMETWIRWTYSIAGVSAPGDFPGAWSKAAEHLLPESDRRPLDPATLATLREVGTWRNFLQHGDAKARKRLADMGVVPGTEPDYLTAEYAQEVIERVDAAFTDAGALLGRFQPGLSRDAMWVPPEVWPARL